jgi:hypothetical protein
MFSTYYHSFIRKYIIGFGTLFNNISIQRLDVNGNRVQTIKCPIAYGPKEKFMVRISQDPNLDQDVAITLPRLGFEITSMTYNPTRKVSSVQKVSNSITGETSQLLRTYSPVPYDINVTLSIFVKNADDGAQIIEQILPYFSPEWNLSMKMIPDLDLIMDIPYVLQNVSLEDTYEGDFDTRRVLIWNLDFLIKGYFFGPTKNSGIIKRTQVDFHGNLDADSARDSRIVITPGLFANGSPTSNSAASIPYSQIEPEDDYGFATDIFEFSDGFRYNPTTGKDE